MSNFECELVADLLPRYIDKKCTKETNEFIKEHISSCEDCRELYEAMSSELYEAMSSELYETMSSELVGVTGDNQRRRRFRIGGGLKVLLIVLGYLGIVVAGLIIFSYILINGVI